jgi:hypothetical protein
MERPGDAAAEQAYEAEQDREFNRQFHRSVVGLVGLVCALVLTVIYAPGFFNAVNPETRIVRVDVVSLTAHAQALPRYPGATVLRHQASAGVTTLHAHYKVSGSYRDRTITFQSYSGTAVPAIATQLLSVHADGAKVNLWYRDALLRRGWCVAGHDTARIPGVTGSVTTVVYLNGRESYEIDFGNGEMMHDLYGGDPQADAQEKRFYKWLTTGSHPGLTDPTKITQYMRSLGDPPNAPLTVHTDYELYPPGYEVNPGGASFQGSATCLAS